MFWKRGNKKTTEEKKENLGPQVRDEVVLGALSLGWYYSEDKNEVQMAKVAEKDRATHFYVIGAPGTGKTKFLEFLISQDIGKGNGFGVIDPHGGLIEDTKGFLAGVCKEEEHHSILAERVVLIDPTDPNLTVTFNPLEKLPNISVPEQVNELIGAFRKIWSESWGVRMEDLMRNSMIALGEAELSLCELPAFLTQRAFRKSIMEKVSHPITQDYFSRFDTLTDRGQIAWIEPVMNKINAFFSDDRIRQMFSSSKSSFNLRQAMDQKKFLLINLDKGKLKGASDLLGSLLMAKIQMAAFSRSDIPQSKRIPFYLYIDEFQNFASESFAVILSEARKYGLSLIMAHQTPSQISTELRSLILGNAGIQVYFRINRQDSQILAKEAFEYSGFEVKSSGKQGSKYWSLGEEWEKHIGELQSLGGRTCYVKHKILGGVIPIETVEVEPAYEYLEKTEAKYFKFLKSLPFGRDYLVERKTLAEMAAKRQESIKTEIEKQKAEVQEKEKTERTKPPHLPSPPRGEELKTKEKAGEEFLPGEKGFLEFINKNPGMFITQIYTKLGLSGYKGDRLKKSLIEKELIRQEETREGEKGRFAKALFLTDKGASVLKKFAAGKGGDKHRNLQSILKEQAELLGWKAGY